MGATTETVGKLLAKAGSTESQAEAQALFAKAQELASKHAIDLTMARWEHGKATKDQLEDRTFEIGAARSVGLKQKVTLFSVVAQANDVRLAIRTDSTAVFPIGYASDLDMTERIYRSLVEQMERFGDEWVASGEWRGDTYGCRDDKPVTSRVARRLFYEGFIARIHYRFHSARMAAEQEAASEARRSDGSGDKALSSLALALRDKSEQVDEFRAQYFKRAGVRGRWRGSSADSGGGYASLGAGHRAADQASMSGREEIDG